MVLQTAGSEDRFQGNGRSIEMSRYIDLDVYHKVERTHPYYVEMIAEINRLMIEAGAGKKALSVFEFGAGTGLATEEFVKHKDMSVTALEIDEECARILSKHIRGKAEVVVGDALVWNRSQHFDLVASVFAHDHIRYENGPALAANIRRNLRKGGLYLMGGEILPHFTNDEQRKESLYRYHGFIVEKALRDEHFEVAQIEIDALKSGLYSIGDFKRHEAQFEQEMLSAAFRLKERIKCGPERSDVGGVYVYSFEAI